MYKEELYNLGLLLDTGEFNPKQFFIVLFGFVFCFF